MLQETGGAALCCISYSRVCSKFTKPAMVHDACPGGLMAVQEITEALGCAVIRKVFEPFCPKTCL